MFTVLASLLAKNIRNDKYLLFSIILTCLFECDYWYQNTFRRSNRDDKVHDPDIQISEDSIRKITRVSSLRKINSEKTCVKDQFCTKSLPSCYRKNNSCQKTKQEVNLVAQYKSIADNINNNSFHLKSDNDEDEGIGSAESLDSNSSDE